MRRSGLLPAESHISIETMRSPSSNPSEGDRKLEYIKLNPPAAIAIATARPNIPTSARPGYLIRIRTPSLKSNHQESSVGKDRAARSRSPSARPGSACPADSIFVASFPQRAKQPDYYMIAGKFSV